VESSFPVSTLIEHIYFHIPFCLSKCGYCSFYSIPYHSEIAHSFMETLHKEIELYQQTLQIRPKTIYFGGGTPSLLKPNEINKLLSDFDLSGCEEITLEMNPITVTEKYLEDLARTRVNRISLGVQSFVDKELKFLERRHTASMVVQKFKLLRDFGFHNISFDLMYGLPNQTPEDIQISLDATLSLNPEHISSYCLSIEEQTPFGEKAVKTLDDDLVADMYFFLRKTLIENGYVHYEISNFAKKGYESRHNLAYWDGKQYLGLGAGASGFIGNVRYQNTEDLDQYFHDMEIKKLYPNGKEESSSDLAKEFIFMNLRKANGFQLSKFKELFGRDFLHEYGDIIQKYTRMNLLTIHEDSITLSPGAYFISNEILQDFM
jgi:oxygen-independent coproporphyrinogen III oxidase